MPRSVLACAVELPADSWFVRAADLSASVPDDQVTTEIDAAAYLGAKREAMRAHETQITVDGDYFALSNESASEPRHRVLHQARGPASARGPGPAGAGRAERDLFAR